MHRCKDWTFTLFCMYCPNAAHGPRVLQLSESIFQRAEASLSLHPPGVLPTSSYSTTIACSAWLLPTHTSTGALAVRNSYHRSLFCLARWNHTYKISHVKYGPVGLKFVWTSIKIYIFQKWNVTCIHLTYALFSSSRFCWQASKVNTVLNTLKVQQRSWGIWSLNGECIHIIMFLSWSLIFNLDMKNKLSTISILH